MKKTIIRLAGLVCVAVLVHACSPAPRRPLTREEKIADMYWLYSQFGENYAPLQYKEQRYGFNYEALKAQYLKAAEETRTNEEFYLLAHKFVAGFRDAHTTSSLVASNLPSRVQVAYFGFDGVRKGNQLLVTALLPTVKTDTFPVKKGDSILKLDGVALPDVIRAEMTGIRDLGNDESNLTYHMSRIFNRTSLAQPLPARDMAILTLKRDDKELTVQLPWIVKDLVTFTKEQQAAAAAAKAGAAALSAQTVRGIDSEMFFRTGFRGLQGEIDLIPSVIKRINRRIPGFRFWDTFVFIDTMPTWTSRLLSQAIGEAAGAPESSLAELGRERNVPVNALVLPAATIYPAYVTPEKVLDSAGKETGATRYVGYLYLNTFSPDAPEEATLAEVRETLRFFKRFGVRELVVDMVNNGGGSLKLGLQLAQLLSKDRIAMPEMQFKVSNSWLDEFENQSLNGQGDAEREVARRVFEGLKQDLAAGKALSSRFSAESLFPFQMNPDPELVDQMKVVLLVNEMCASMCDIFSAVLKDNDRARVVGSRTMGAGGNVVSHFEAPNSHLTVNQTESLVLRKDGSYVENNGVEPDVAMAVNEAVSEKYEPVRRKAVELLMRE